MPILLLDGGLGTTLETPPYNITFTAATPLWSSHLLLTSPSTLAAAHRAFLDAGADILLTPTYQSSIEGFARTDARYTAADAERYMRSAVALVSGVISSAAGAGPERRRPCRVALSLGPFGATMSPVAAEYTGVYPGEMDGEGPLRGWHARRLRVFFDEEEEGSWNRVDYVAFETVRRADEVRAVRGAVGDVLRSRSHQGQREKMGKPWWICGVFPAEVVDEGDVRRWVRAAVGGGSGLLPRPWGIGVNCTRVQHVAEIVGVMQDEMRLLMRDEGEDGFVDEWESSSGKPWLVVYPDGTKGERYDLVTKTWVATEGQTVARSWDETLWEVVQRARGEWEGIVVGGCCRAGPSDIAALRRRIDSEEAQLSL